MRLTAKPRYLLLLHRGNEKSNTVTALPISANGARIIILFSLCFRYFLTPLVDIVFVLSNKKNKNNTVLTFIHLFIYSEKKISKLL